MTIDPRCDNCRFWRADEAEGYDGYSYPLPPTTGACRRFPPAMDASEKRPAVTVNREPLAEAESPEAFGSLEIERHQMMQLPAGVTLKQVESRWPLVKADEWCGEHQARKEG